MNESFQMLVYYLNSNSVIRKMNLCPEYMVSIYPWYIVDTEVTFHEDIFVT